MTTARQANPSCVRMQVMSVTQTLSGASTSNFRSLVHNRWLAAIAAGAAPVADLRRDPGKLRQSGDPVRTDAFALFNQIIMQLAIAVDLAALRPGLVQQPGLTPVLPHARVLGCAFSHAWNPPGWMRGQRHIVRTEN